MREPEFVVQWERYVEDFDFWSQSWFLCDRIEVSVVNTDDAIETFDYSLTLAGGQQEIIRQLPDNADNDQVTIRNMLIYHRNTLLYSVPQGRVIASKRRYAIQYIQYKGNFIRTTGGLCENAEVVSIPSTDGKRMLAGVKITYESGDIKTFCALDTGQPQSSAPYHNVVAFMNGLEMISLPYARVLEEPDDGL